VASVLLDLKRKAREMKKQTVLGACVAILIAISVTPVRAQGVLADSYPQTDGFLIGLPNDSGAVMTIAWDGTNYWAVSGGSAGGVRLAQYDDSGNVLQTYSPGLDFRSVFTRAGDTTLYARTYASRTIYVQMSPGQFAPALSLVGGNLDDQSSVVWNGDGTELIAMKGGTVSRWGETGAFLGTLTLSGFGTLGSENTYPQDRGIAVGTFGQGFFLTYSAGTVSAWDPATGSRVGTASLEGASTSFDSHFSFSYTNGDAFVASAFGGSWQGFAILDEVIVAKPLTLTSKSGSTQVGAQQCTSAASSTCR
jgi:hypothetical protein